LSVSFDQAADYYDQTRSLPDNLMAQLVSLLVAELPSGPCLEIGIGTGRIALPLMRQGVDVYGVDISMAMVRKLVQKAGGWPLPVAIADATRLPFAGATFSSAIASHVLHLIPGWRSAVDELLRVVRPRGVVVASRGGRGAGEEWTRAVRRHFFEAVNSKHGSPGADRIDDVDRYMTELGAAVHKLAVPSAEGAASVAQVIVGLEAGYFSACWAIDEDTRHAAGESTKRWAATEFGDVDAMRPTRHESHWHAYVLP